MPITSLTFWLWGHNEFTFLQSLFPSPLWQRCQLVLSSVVEKAGLWKSVEVDDGPVGEEMHCPLLCFSYQFCVCLRTGVLSEIPLKWSRTDSDSSKSEVAYINVYVQRLGIKSDWGLSLVWQIHLQNRYVFDHVLTAPGLSSVLDLDLFSFSLSSFSDAYSPAIVIMLLKQVCVLLGDGSLCSRHIMLCHCVSVLWFMPGLARRRNQI